MKAESIEQIREHLAKGGRALAVLKDGRTDEVKRVDMGMLRVYAGIWSSSFACVDVDHWQLLPLEEKEPETLMGRIQDAGVRAYYGNGESVLRVGTEKEPVDHGTQKGQEEEYIEVESGCHIPVPCEMRLNKRIRQRLLHGQWPEMQDLLSWWEATTGERIEWGRRCVICEGQGRLKSNSGDKRQGYEYTGCPGCTNGYSVRPTWMNQ